MESVNFCYCLFCSWCITKTSSSLWLLPHEQDQCCTIFMSTDLISISSLVMVALARSIWYRNERRYSLISKHPIQVQSMWNLWWTKCCCNQLVFRYSIFPLSVSLHKCTKHIPCVCVLLLLLHNMGKWQVSLNDTLKEAAGSLNSR